MRAFGFMVIASGFVIAWVFYAVFWTGYQAKRLTSKQGRQEIKAEITDTANFIAKDKDFHKALNKEFKGTYIFLGLLAIVFIATALGLGD